MSHKPGESHDAALELHRHADTPLHMVRSPGCGCCAVWAEALRRRGLTITVSENPDYIAMKTEGGVPEAAYSCHTSRMGGYVIEGHVPPEAIAKLMDERPAVDGIGVPGMPAGSLGMGYDESAVYEVVAWTDGVVAEAPFFVTGGTAR